MAVTKLTSQNNAYALALKQSHAHQALSDEAYDRGVDIVQGVNSRGLTYVGAFAEHDGIRYQLTITESGDITRTIDGLPTEVPFNAFMPAAGAVERFVTKQRESLIAYSTLDRKQRQAALIEVVIAD